jgi:hypothetical protein
MVRRGPGQRDVRRQTSTYNNSLFHFGHNGLPYCRKLGPYRIGESGEVYSKCTKAILKHRESIAPPLQNSI